MTGKIQVLYVDDDPALLEIGKIYLQKYEDFTITTLPSAKQALDSLETETFDAIISDYQMPHMDGIEFLIEVRRSGNQIPFILFTGRGREEVVIKALNEGADFYLQKGGDPKSQFTELAHKIKQAIKQRNLESNIRNLKRREADIINFLPDATLAINSEGIIIAWNRAMEELTGLCSSEMIGKGNYEYALPFYHERRPILLDLVIREDPETYAKYPSIKRDGNFLSAEITIPHFHEGTGASLWFTASPLYDNQGVVIGAIESIREITEIKRAEAELRLDESRLEALLQLNQIIDKPLQDITHFALEQAVLLTESTIGYIAFVNEEESELTMHAWSKVAMEECQIQEKHIQYQVSSTGLWGEPLRQRCPVITNDFAATNPLKKGTPDGHVHLIRHLGIPVFDGDRIVIIAGVGNKSDNYGPSDIRQLELLMGGMWTILQRKHVELTLLKNNEELHAAYEELSATEEELRSNLHEITQYKESLEESKHQLQVMAENIPGVVYRFRVNPDGSYDFDYISERSRQLFGVENDPATFFDQVTQRMTPPERERLMGSIQEAVRNRSLWNFEGAFTKPSGDTAWFRATSSPVVERDRLIFDGVILDISDNKRSELEIEKKHMELMASYEQLAATEEELRHSHNELLRQEHEISHKSDMLSIINGIISAANRSNNFSSLLRDVLKETLHLLDFDGGGIYIVDPMNRIANLSCSQNLPSEFLQEIQSIPIDKSPYDRLFTFNESILTENYALLAPERSKKFGYQSLASIPLLSKEIAIGALNLASTKRYHISVEEKQTLEAVGRELGSTIERMLSEEKARQVSHNLETLFNSIDEMIFVLDLQGNILVSNDAVQKWLMYSSNELIGNPIFKLYEHIKIEGASQDISKILNYMDCSYPVIIRAKNGSLIETETRITKGWWDNHEILIAVSRFKNECT
jgi:PAS domain S-box-containing protein